MTVMQVEFTARCPSCSGDAVWLAQRTPVAALDAAYANGNPLELAPIAHTYRITCDVGGGPCHVTPNN